MSERRTGWRRSLLLAVLVLLALPTVLIGGFVVLMPVIGPYLPSVLYERPVPELDAVATLALQRDLAAFYAKVTFAEDKASVWLRSADGGATWEKVDHPTDYTGVGSSADVLRCADDQVCYAVRSVGAAGPGQRIDRIDTDGTWHTETTFDSGCGGRQALLVQPSYSGQALAQCGPATVAHRTADGQWVEQDLVALAKTLR